MGDWRPASELQGNGLFFPKGACAHIHLYVYIHVYVYIYIYTHTHTYTYIYAHTHMYKNIYIERERERQRERGRGSMYALRGVWECPYIGKSSPKYTIWFADP